MTEQDGTNKILFQAKKNAIEEVRITKSMFKGSERIDIRLYALDRDGEHKPTKKGISLPINDFRAFRDAVAAIELPSIKEEDKDENGNGE